MKLNRKVEYALIALKHMSAKAPGVLTSAKEISDVYGCPFDVTARVLQRMAQAELLKSVHGAQGGYQIIKDLREISFYDLRSWIVGPVSVSKCAEDSLSACDLVKDCNILQPIQKFNAKVRRFYQELPVTELLGVSSAQELRP